MRKNNDMQDTTTTGDGGGLVGECRPADGTEWWTHHWIGPKGGDSEPWMWSGYAEWRRGDQCLTPEQMDRRRWVYDGPCERPEVVADLRRRLAAAEARAGDAVVPFPARSPTP